MESEAWSNRVLELQGVFYYQGKSCPYPATLMKQDALLNVAINGERVLSVTTQDVEVSAALASIPSRLVFANGDVFECLDNAQFKTLFDADGSKFSKVIHQLESSTKFVILALVLVPVLAYLSSIMLMPKVAKQLAPAIPKALVERLDLQVMESLDGFMLAPSTASSIQRDQLQLAWSSLPQRQNYSLKVRNGGVIGANAMALPGGTIIVTDELLDLLTRAELMAVLAHEMGHVALNHGLRNIIQTLGVTAVISTVIGDVSLLAEAVLVAAPVLLQQMSYSRDMEREADDYGRQKLAQLGVSPACLGLALSKLVASHASDDKPGEDASHVGEWNDYLSSHPNTQERIDASKGEECRVL